MKIFISQPMHGKTDEEILADRENIISNITANYGDNLEFVDSFIKGASGSSPLWFLAKSIEKLATADAIYFASGWKEARGCIIEYECAERYGIKMLNI